MDSFNQEQFWQALQRLYDSTLENTKQIEENTRHIAALIRIAESHDQRLDDLEGNQP